MGIQVHIRKFVCVLRQIMTGDSLREVGKIAHGWDRDLVSFTTTLTIPNTAVQPRHKALLLAASFLMVRVLNYC